MSGDKGLLSQIHTMGLAAVPLYGCGCARCVAWHKNHPNYGKES